MRLFRFKIANQTSRKGTRVATVELQTSNKIWLTYKHFPYKAWNAIAELVDNSSQAFFDHRSELEAELGSKDNWFSVRIDFSRDEKLSVVDNAIGMDLDDLERAIQLGTPPSDTSGRSEFGMGMKTSCCWLGNTWKIITKKLGNNTEYTLTVDVEALAASEGQLLDVVEKHVADTQQHYTIIEVTGLHRRLHGRTLGRAKTYLTEMFRDDISNGAMELRWDGTALEPEPIEPLITEEGDVRREWRQDINFEVEGHPVTGWICILRKGSRKDAGFDLVRRGRVINGRPLGYRPGTIFGEARNDLINQRIYGRLNLDDFPVNHLKDDFLWDGLEDEFQDKIAAAATEYIAFARSYRTRKGEKNVSAPVVHATNDELAEELSEEQMLERLTIAEVGEMPPDPDPAIQEAKAEELRSQKIEPRIVEVGNYTFRIFHPESMPATDAYFFRQSAASNEIDIFINDNHPYVLEVTDDSDYLMYARMCAIDAITEHFTAQMGTDKLLPSTAAKIKDHLLRGFHL